MNKQTIENLMMNYQTVALYSPQNIIFFNVKVLLDQIKLQCNLQFANLGH